MTHARFIACLLLGGAFAGCGGSRGAVFVFPGAVDANVADAADAAVDASKPDTNPPDLNVVDMAVDAMPGCGTRRPDITGIARNDGLAIGRDGTLYFTQSVGNDGWVGRLRPTDPVPKTQWVSVVGGTRLLGLALDSARGRLYIVSESTGTIYFVDLAGAVDPPVLQPLVTGLLKPNDVAMGADGKVYFSSSEDRKIYSVTAAGVKTEVTRTPFAEGQPSGIAFGTKGELFVGLITTGPLFKLNLVGGLEQSRSIYGSYTGWGNGLAVDQAGRLYVANYNDNGALNQAHVVRIDPGGALGMDSLTGMGFGSVAFGRGVLVCSDLYIASPYGPLQRWETDQPGLSLP